MKILSVTAQKPNSTGSGVYLTELVKEYEKTGHKQAVIAGIGPEDVVELPEGTAFYPVYFGSTERPYPVVGMSDEMPYESTRYCDMTPEMTEQFRAGFQKALQRAAEEFAPDLILCHHLYLLTAIVREAFPDLPVYGFCHNTDLRQMRKTDLERDFIRRQIRKLDRIFVLQEAQKEQVAEIYGAAVEKISVVGIGYNSQIFRCAGEKPEDGVIRIAFAGKITQKKGVASLLRSLLLLAEMPSFQAAAGKKRPKIQVTLAGGAGNREEYQRIRKLAETCPYEIRFPGRLPQTELARIYQASDLFVLPSFYEGLPLTVIEALACGAAVVVTDLPGIRDWLDENVKGGDIRYVPMPRMRHVDDPEKGALSVFEQQLAGVLRDSIVPCIRGEKRDRADVSRISWETIAGKVLAQL